ncbi:hypothetical protein GC105_11500 [Alkalibaculum sp. M08DMB]|uniref:Uncharacterized protein n=1 Tax=Alkalibaculum sporogenes TaxID=2655001 RepID=A0A6A7KAE1_9FIRM|nr:hypothetical protein [Alkalibaculum sporogenes]MPW26414.1 hypothetical protein [Alkalibaculum sporogenes]
MDWLLWVSVILIVIGIILVVYLIINKKELDRDINKKHIVSRNSWIFGAVCFLLTIILAWWSGDTSIISYTLKVTSVVLFLINAFISHKKISKDNL